MILPSFGSVVLHPNTPSHFLQPFPLPRLLLVSRFPFFFLIPFISLFLLLGPCRSHPPPSQSQISSVSPPKTFNHIYLCIIPNNFSQPFFSYTSNSPSTSQDFSFTTSLQNQHRQIDFHQKTIVDASKTSPKYRQFTHASFRILIIA
jgi:hypothetical protein